MKRLIVMVLALVIAVPAFAAVPVRKATQAEVETARNDARFHARAKLMQVLFGLGRVPPGCDLFLIDPEGSDADVRNLMLDCFEPLTICSVLNCED